MPILLLADVEVESDTNVDVGGGGVDGTSGAGATGGVDSGTRIEL